MSDKMDSLTTAEKVSENINSIIRHLCNEMINLFVVENTCT